MNQLYRTSDAAEQPGAAGTTPRRAPHGRGAARWLNVHGPLGLAVAALLALVFARWLFGFAILRGTSPFWWRDHADVTQYLAGFNAFVHEPWHWPLLRIESLNTPEGTLATFVDAIPLYALFLKLVHPGKGYWNPYGLWITLCFTLQGVGAWWICREAKVRNLAALAALALLLASFPALTFRLPHTSLMSQWLLVFALAVYLRSGRLGRIATGAWMALLVGGFYINIYLFSMASAIFAADVLRHALRPRAPAPAIARALLAPVAVYGTLFATMWITMLPLPPGSTSQEWGFGYYSMNLLAPLHGGQFLQFDHPTAHDGQGEGYNYLGIFVLALTAFVVRLYRRRDPAFWARHGALLGVLAVLTLYALSNIVYLGNVRLFTVWLPPELGVVTSTFRSSGRFFWPVGYAIIVFAVLGVARHMRALPAAALLAAVVALHFFDLQPHNERARATAALNDAPAVDEARWNAFLGPDAKALHYYPPFHCGESAATEGLLPVMAYAVKHHLPMSTGYIARTAKPCTGYDAEIARLPAATAVAFDKKIFPLEQDAQHLMGGNATCADMGIVFLCRRNITNPAVSRR